MSCLLWDQTCICALLTFSQVIVLCKFTRRIGSTLGYRGCSTTTLHICRITFLCFGAKSAPFIFSRITDAVSRIMRSRGFICYNYLDDFITMADSHAKCLEAQHQLITLLRSLGFYIAWSKVTSPNKVCRYLGIDIDTSVMQLRLPADKIDKFHGKIIPLIVN